MRKLRPVRYRPPVDLELWWRNPLYFLPHVTKKTLLLTSWNELFLHRKRLDPLRINSMHYADGIPWRTIIVRADNRSAYELRPGSTHIAPYHEHEVWAYGHSDELLEEKIAAVRGTADPRIIIVDLPKFQRLNWPFYKWMSEVQEDNPDIIFHAHGLFGFTNIFGLGWRAADYDPTTICQSGGFILPCGKHLCRRFLHEKDLPLWNKWAGLVGWTADLDDKTFSDRLDLTIESAIWASRHFMEDFHFKFQKMNGDRPYKTARAISNAHAVSPFTSVKTPPMLGDKLLCDRCSLAPTCRLYREGSVCTLSGSESVELAKHFKTRDSSVVISGLSQLMETQAERLRLGVDAEKDVGELDPRVSRVWKDMFEAGVKLAKLVDPSLNGSSPGGGTTFIGSVSFVDAGSTSDRVAAAMAALEHMGIPREHITNDMLEAVLEGKAVPITPAIAKFVETTAVEKKM